MGEVWRATDTRIGREVALKLVPEAFASDPDRLARFDREAKLLASLAHPNIATLFGLEEIEGQRVLAMELVEGETLAARLGRGRLPLEDALEVARQTAAALEEAHEKGVVHRDLKPANLKLTPQGSVKVLDFGLAKAYRGEWSGGSADVSSCPTMSRGETQAGVILGTAPYMAPEQARGMPVDKRADIWAYGVVLFEMLSGRRAFPGETVSDTLAAVIRAEPDWAALPANVPAPIFTLLRRCLRKDRLRRLRDIGEARIAIDECQAGLADVSPGGETSGRRRAWPRAVLIGLVGLLGGAGLARHLVLKSPRAARPSAMRFSAVTTLPGLEAQPSLSPDGRSIAFVSNRSGQFDVWVGLTAGGRLVQITNDPNVDADPRWSPDGSQIAFSKLNDRGRWDIWLVPALGGTPHRVVANGKEPAWSPDGRSIAYANLKAATIWMADATGSNPRALTKAEPGPGFSWQRRPAISHDGLRVAFERRTGGPYMDLGVAEVATGRMRPLTTDIRLAASPAWSHDDASVYFGSSRGGAVNIWKVSSSGGEPEQITVGQGDDADPSLSVDGRRMVFTTYRQKYSIGEVDLDSTQVEARIKWVTSDAARTEIGPVYSPDGRRIAYFSARRGVETESIWVVGADGADPEPLVRDGYRNIFPLWAADGQSLLFSSWSDDMELVVRRAVLVGGPAELVTSEFLLGPHTDSRGRLVGSSPDGHGKIYDPALRKAERLEACVGEGFRWSPDGSRLAFVKPTGSDEPGLWVYDFQGPPKLAFGGWVVAYTWSRRNELLVAEGKPDLRALLSRVRQDGLGRETLRFTLPIPFAYWDHDFYMAIDASPDGRRLALSAPEQMEADIAMIEGFP
jgi:Tol biopolymer transport system component